MDNHKYDKKLEQKLLVEIYKKYTHDKGEQPSQLSVYHFNKFHDTSIYDSIPEILTTPIKNNQANPYAIYFQNLEHSNFISWIKSPLNPEFVLTEKGYERAQEILKAIGNKNSRHKSEKHTKEIHNPILFRIMEGVIIGILILCIGWIAGHYFSIDM